MDKMLVFGLGLQGWGAGVAYGAAIEYKERKGMRLG